MIPLPSFEVHAPESLDETLALVRRHAPNVAILAGGTDLVVAMKLGLVAPRHVVSLRNVRSLYGVSRAEDHLVIGAMTPLEEVAALRDAGALAEAAALVGGPHHRRAGTLGGNLCLDTRCQYIDQGVEWRRALGHCIKKDGLVCHVVPGGRNCVAAASNDTAAASIALECELEIIGPRGPRRIRAAEFWIADGARNVSLDEGEIVTALRVPMRSGRRSAYEKLRRRASLDFPLLSVAVRADFDGAAPSDLVVVLSALAAKPRIVPRTRELAATRSLADVADGIAKLARAACHPLPNVDDDVEWRKEMAPVLVKRALARLAAR